MPGSRCACLADLGSFVSNNSRFLVVVILAPFGWMMHLPGSCFALSVAVAPIPSSDNDDAVSIRAVSSKFGGLAQPVSVGE